MTNSDEALEMRDVRAGYGDADVLHGASFSVRRGEIVAVVGANGAGKSTAVRCIMGLIPARGGTVLLDGVELDRTAPWKRARLGLGCVPERRQVFGELSVLENLIVGTLPRRPAMSTRAIASRVDDITGLFPVLETIMTKPASLLSGGQQQMLAIGRALMSEPRYLIMDEPSLGLAPSLVAEIFGMIQKTAETAGVLLLEQNARAALAIADRGIMFSEGHVTMSGTGQELLHSPQLTDLYLGSAAPTSWTEAHPATERLRTILRSR